MKDRDFLMWIHDRLTEVHGEDPILDYMHRLRAIIYSTPTYMESKNVLTCNNLPDLRKYLF